MFKQIPLTMIKALTQKQKVQKLMTEIGGGWYMEKIAKGLPPLRRTKISKNHKIRMELKKYMRLISGGTIVNSDDTGTILNGLIQ